MVFDQPPFAAVQAQRELGHRGIGDVGEAGPDPGDFRALLVDGVDEADQGDVDLAMEVGDEVGEFLSPPNYLLNPQKKRS